MVNSCTFGNCWAYLAARVIYSILLALLLALVMAALAGVLFGVRGQSLHPLRGFALATGVIEALWAT